MRNVIYAIGILAMCAAGIGIYATRSDAQTRWDPLTLTAPGSSIGITVRDAESGVVVERVREESPASRAGLREGDVITEFDGERTRSAAQFSRLVRETAPGRTVKIIVLRSGSTTSLDITPETRTAGDIRFPDITADQWERFRVFPRDFALDFSLTPFGPGRLGVTVTPLGEQLAGYFGVKQGVLVTEVTSGSPAEAAGLKAGDVITTVAGRTVSDPDDLVRQIREVEAGASVEIRVMRERKEMTVSARMPERQRSTARGGRRV